MQRNFPLFCVALTVLGLCIFSLIPSRTLALNSDTRQTVFFDLSAFGSAASDMESMSNNAVGFGWAARGGWRMKNIGLFLECQRDRWLSAEQTIDVVNGVINLGVGADYQILSGRVKMTISAGTSTLLFDTILDPAGTTGIYVDFHPTILRWPLTDRITLELSPLSATLLVPVLKEPMLKRLEYRTSMGIEVTF